MNSSNVRIASNDVSYSGIGHISLLGGIRKCTVSNNRVEYGGFYSETMNAPGSSAISINDAGNGNRIIDNSVGKQIDLTFIDGNGIILDLMQDGASVVACTAFSRPSPETVCRTRVANNIYDLVNNPG